MTHLEKFYFHYRFQINQNKIALQMILKNLSYRVNHLVFFLRILKLGNDLKMEFETHHT